MGSVKDLEEHHCRELLAQHARGEPDAFGRLMEQISQPLLTYLQRIGVRPENREDLLQDIIIAVHRNAALYDPSLALKPWVFTIAVNKVRDHFKRDRWLRALPLLDFLAASHFVTPERKLHEQQEINHLQNELESLPLKQREALVMQSIHGLEISEIAEIQKIPVNTVKTNLRRARQYLINRRSSHE